MLEELNQRYLQEKERIKQMMQAELFRENYEFEKKIESYFDELLLPEQTSTSSTVLTQEKENSINLHNTRNLRGQAQE